MMVEQNKQLCYDGVTPDARCDCYDCMKKIPLSEKGVVIQTGNPADPIDEEVFDYRDVKQAIEEAYKEIQRLCYELDQEMINRVFKDKFGFDFDAILGLGEQHE